MPVALGILTRGRPADAIACAQSAVDCAAIASSTPLPVYILVDDDRAAFERIAVRLAAQPHIKVGLLPLRHYYVRGMNALFAWMADDGVDHFVVSNDDVTFVRAAWDRLALQHYQDACGDWGVLELAGPELCAHYLSRVAFFVEHFDGQIAEPAYTFYCSDTELRERCRALGAYHVWTDQPILRHNVKDDGVRSEVMYWMPRDRAQYARRWQPGWHREVWQ